MAVDVDFYVIRLRALLPPTNDGLALIDAMEASLLIVLLGFQQSEVRLEEEDVQRMFNRAVRRTRHPPLRTAEQLRRETWQWQLWFDRTFDFVQPLLDDTLDRIEPENDADVPAWSDTRLLAACMQAARGLIGVATLHQQIDELPSEFVEPVRQAWASLPVVAEKIRSKLESLGAS